MDTKTLLYNNDCLEVMKELEPNSIDLVVTDPPYNVSKGRTDITFKGKRADIKQNFGECDVFESELQFGAFTVQWLNAAHRVLKLHRVLCFFWSIKKLDVIPQLLEATGFRFLDYFFKVTSNPCPAFRKAGFWSAVEPVIICQKVDKDIKPVTPPFRRDIVGQPNYVKCPVVSCKQRTVHPTQKPEAVIEPLIKYYSREGEWVLDPFSGVFTVGVVAKKMNRNFIGIEKDETYFIIGKERIDNAKGEHINV